MDVVVEQRRIKGRGVAHCLSQGDKTRRGAPLEQHTGVGRASVSSIQQAERHRAEVNLPGDCAHKTMLRGPARGAPVMTALGAIDGPTTAIKSSSTFGTKGSLRKASMAAAKEEWKKRKEEPRLVAPTTARILATF